MQVHIPCVHILTRKTCFNHREKLLSQQGSCFHCREPVFKMDGIFKRRIVKYPLFSYTIGARTVYLFCCQILDQTPINQRAFLVSKPELAISCSSVKKVCESSLVFTLQFSHWWKFWHTRLFIIPWKPQWKPYKTAYNQNIDLWSKNTHQFRILYNLL